MHEFEHKELGKPPFYVRDLIIHDGRDTKCDACGTEIKKEFIVESSDGQSFSVGSTCVEKTGDKQLIQAAEDKIQAVKDKLINTKLNRMRCLLKDDNILQSLATKPHPTDYYAQQGKTLMDYVNFTNDNGGKTGHLKIAEIVEGIYDELQS